MDLNETTIDDLLSRVEQLEQRVEDLEAENERLQTEVEDTRNHSEAVSRRVDTVQTGVTELQVRELQAGAMLSTDGVADYTISHELGLDIQYCGDDQQYVRLDSPEDVGDEQAMAASIPDAAEMCQVEQLRQVWRRGLMDLENLGDADTQRCIRVWDTIDTLASKAGTGGKHWRIDSEKVRRIIDKHEDVKHASLYELSRRVMMTLETLTDGLLTCKDDNGLHLVGDQTAIQDALKPLYESAQMDDGSNIVVRR